MFENYYNELVGYFSKMLRDGDRARDVVHEGYCRVLNLDIQKVHIKEPRALLYKTVRNVIVDRHRYEARHPYIYIEDVPSLHQEDSTLDIISAKERIDKLNHVIDSLPLRCKEAFMLFKFEGLSQAEIAQKMGISKNMVEKHIIKAMKACKECLKELDS